MKNHDDEFLKAIRDIAGDANVRIGEPMWMHTTFKIGGEADYFAEPCSIDEIKALVKCASEYNVPYYIVGNGSNLLVSDLGYRGLIIHLGSRFAAIEYCGDGIVRAQAGVRLSVLGNELAKRGLAGFEFATGIPGSVGGAVRMNAGAYGREIADVIVSARILNTDGAVVTLEKEELELGYRTSIVEDKGYVVLEAEFELDYGEEDEIRRQIDELAAMRREKQPLEYPSAGSTFKRPEGYFAGKLIADAGLKGLSVGKAEVSKKHAGFVINTGGATAADVIALTEQIKEKIIQEYGVELELEIRRI